MSVAGKSIYNVGNLKSRAADETDENAKDDITRAEAFSKYLASMFSIEGCNKFGELEQKDYRC